MSTLSRRLVVFSGHVQGVGFRYNVHQMAANFDVTGHVRNLENGQVELVAEGVDDVLDDFVAAINERMLGHIKDMTSETETVSKRQFAEFRISTDFG